MFDKRFRKTLTVHRMLRKGDRVVAGLSGGKDSTVLLHSLAALRKDLPFELVALTIDEGIRGYRARTLRIARAECERLGIEQKVLRFGKEAGRTLDRMVRDETRSRKPGTANPLPCTHCGVVRRYLLNRGARELGATKLALGHNLDDMAQTVLMNIMRNDPNRLARLNESAPKDARFVPRIRPLMLTPERENAVYAMLRGIEIEHVECPYARFAFRGHIRTMLNQTEERYPGTKYKIVNSLLAMEKALRTGLPEGGTVGSCPGCGEPSSGRLCMFCARAGRRNDFIPSE